LSWLCFHSTVNSPYRLALDIGDLTISSSVIHFFLCKVVTCVSTLSCCSSITERKVTVHSHIYFLFVPSYSTGQLAPSPGHCSLKRGHSSQLPVLDLLQKWDPARLLKHDLWQSHIFSIGNDEKWHDFIADKCMASDLPEGASLFIKLFLHHTISDLQMKFLTCLFLQYVL